MKKVLWIVIASILISTLFILFSDNDTNHIKTDSDITESYSEDKTNSDKATADNTSSDKVKPQSNPSSDKQDSTNSVKPQSNPSSDKQNSTDTVTSSNKSQVNQNSSKPSKNDNVIVSTPDGVIINPTSSMLQQLEQDSSSKNSYVSSDFSSIITETETEKETEIELEGEKEEITLTLFKTDDYSVWIDKEYFKIGSAEPSLVTIRAINNSKVSMTIMKNYFGMDIAPKRYSNFLKSENLYSVSEITKMEKPIVKGAKHLTAKANGKQDEYISAYFIPYDDVSFTIVLSCPNEAIEGYGARMENLLREIKFK